MCWPIFFHDVPNSIRGPPEDTIRVSRCGFNTRCEDYMVCRWPTEEKTHNSRKTGQGEDNDHQGPARLIRAGSGESGERITNGSAGALISSGFTI